MSTPRLVIGTRSSALATAQTRLVVAALEQSGAAVEVAVEFISTMGDRPRTPAPGAPVKGEFVKELEEALRRGTIDCAVHSAKDLPAAGAAGLEIAAVLPRADARDALVSRTGVMLEALPAGAVVGTSSPRRRAQVLAVRPDVTPAPLRGNVDTRLRALDDGDYDAIVLAVAGLERLGLAGRITERLDTTRFLPSPGQGALAVQIRADDETTRRLVVSLTDMPSARAVRAELACAAAVEGGCSAPFGALATVDGDTLSLRAALYSLDGKRQVALSAAGPAADPDALGRHLAERLVRAGGRELAVVAA